MSGINTGILTNAQPLSTEQIKALEKETLNEQKSFVYLDQNSELCFSLPHGIDMIKELAWNNAYELSTEAEGFIKKIYKKDGLDSFYLYKILRKQNINDSWIEEERLDGDGSEYYTLAPTALSFRSTAPLNELQEIQINGVTVDPSNYTLEEGSTIVTFPIDYLKTLNVGGYEVNVVSKSKAVKGDFTVKAPELNEYGFYYNQPYAAYVSALECIVAIFIKNDGTILAITLNNTNLNSEICSYTINGSSLEVNSPSFGTVICTIGPEATEIYCNTLNTKLTVYEDSLVADKQYLYVNRHFNNYEVHCLDKTNVEYSDIKTNINGRPTASLADYMFEGNTNIIKAPKIPNTVGFIGFGAFLNCKNLQSISLPDSIIEIGEDAFSGCKNLTNLNIPRGVHVIYPNAFRGCNKLIKVKNGVHYVNNWVVGVDENIKEITLSPDTEGIVHSAFLFSSVEHVNIPMGATYISKGAFCGSEVKSITIPSSVTTIHNDAFGWLHTLTEINYNGTIEQWRSIDGSINCGTFTNVAATHVQCSDGQVEI